jgi:PAS domain S-box-containing protein
LRESENQFREVLENSSDVAYKRDLRTGFFNYLSPVFFQISGYSAGDMNNFSLDTRLELIHPEDRNLHEKAVNEAIANYDYKTHQIEYRFKHRDGTYHWFLDKFTVTY